MSKLNTLKDSKVRDKDGNLLKLYHGTPYGKFYTFKGDMFFFSKSKRFAEDYAETKSFDYGLDARTTVVEAYLNAKKLFNPKNEADLQALKEVLDDKTDFGFAGYKISKDDLIENLKGNDVIKPYWTKEQIDKAEFGKVIGQARDGYNNDLYVATKGNDVLYTPMVNHEYVRALTPEKISELIEKGTIREKI